MKIKYISARNDFYDEDAEGNEIEGTRHVKVTVELAADPTRPVSEVVQEVIDRLTAD